MIWTVGVLTPWGNVRSPQPYTKKFRQLRNGESGINKYSALWRETPKGQPWKHTSNMDRQSKLCFYLGVYECNVIIMKRVPLIGRIRRCIIGVFGGRGEGYNYNFKRYVRERWQESYHPFILGPGLFSKKALDCWVLALLTKHKRNAEVFILLGDSGIRIQVLT